MVRILGILVGLGFCGVAAWSLLWGVVQYLKDPPQATVEAVSATIPSGSLFSSETLTLPSL